MGKRHRSADSNSNFTQEDYDHASEYEDSDDQSYNSLSLSRKKNKRSHRPASDELSRHQRREVDIGENPFSHPRSFHIIHSPGSIRTALLRWFEGVQASRCMPWRKPYNPSQGPGERSQRAYEVWVSEIMLQQTQVVTVIPYYTRWMQKFPTVHALAASTVDEVNTLWKGLGYYSRASRLLAGAQKVVNYYNGRLPDNAKDLEANIPGIGRYSAGAIASIAYGERVPVLDGNVHRLLSRVLALHAPPKSKATLDILWEAAADIVHIEEENVLPTGTNEIEGTTMNHTQYAGDINQALIELGSTVCKVRDPNCEACPLRPWCRAYDVSRPRPDPQKLQSVDSPNIKDMCNLCEPLQDIEDVTLYPMKPNRKKPREELDIVNVIEWHPITKPDQRWFLLIRRPEGGKASHFIHARRLLAGLYEFPTSSNVSKAISRTAQNKIPNALLSQFLVPTVLPYDTRKKKVASGESLLIESIKPVGDVLHVFSHIKKTYRPQWVVLVGGNSPPILKYETTELSATSKLSVTDRDEDGLSPSLRPNAMWVELKEVSSANIGTGVMKVWKSTKNLWEKDIDGS